MKEAISAYILTITGMNLDQSKSIGDAVGESPIGEMLAVSNFLVGGDDNWAVEAHYGEKPDVEGLKFFLKDVFGISLEGLEFRTANMPDKDWVTESLQGLAPVRAGRFFVHGSHDENIVPANALGIKIDASLAFGTGHHGTSEGCLLALEQVIKKRKFRHILDLGCGTALLAIGAAKALHVPVLATDIDEEAVRVARENTRINGVGKLVRCETATGFSHPAFAQWAPFDLILANILARPLMDMSEDMARHMETDGMAILSGLLVEQSPRVEARFRAAGFRIVSRLRRGEWATLTLRAA